VSDRPCNLESYLKYRAKFGPSRVTVRPLSGRWIGWFVDGEQRGTFGALPGPLHCGVFGGECEC
jgi:hypothetical protein